MVPALLAFSTQIKLKIWSEVLVIELKIRGKPEYLEKNLTEQDRQPATNSIKTLSLSLVGARTTLGGGDLSPLRGNH